VRTVRSECLDWLVILNEQHLERVLYLLESRSGRRSVHSARRNNRARRQFVVALARVISLRTSILRVLDGDDDATCRDGRARRLVPGVAARTVRGPKCTPARVSRCGGVTGVQAARRSYR
jgi:hypothetical protein